MYTTFKEQFRKRRDVLEELKKRLGGKEPDKRMLTKFTRMAGLDIADPVDPKEYTEAVNPISNQITNQLNHLQDQIKAKEPNEHVMDIVKT